MTPIFNTPNVKANETLIGSEIKDIDYVDGDEDCQKLPVMPTPLQEILVMNKQHLQGIVDWGKKCRRTSFIRTKCCSNKRILHRRYRTPYISKATTCTVKERLHTRVIEKIQPLIQREIVKPHVITRTAPIHEKGMNFFLIRN